MTAAGQQWTELDSRDLTSFLILTRVDTDQVQRRFIPDCGTILCQLQKTWSYQGLLYLKKRPPHLHSSPTWLAMSVLSSQTSVLCPALAWMQELPRSSPVRNPGRKAQVWTSNHLSHQVPLELHHTVTDCQAVRRKSYLKALPETSSPRGKLKESFVFYSCLQVD